MNQACSLMPSAACSHTSCGAPTCSAPGRERNQQGLTLSRQAWQEVAHLKVEAEAVRQVQEVISDLECRHATKSEAANVRRKHVLNTAAVEGIDPMRLCTSRTPGIFGT